MALLELLRALQNWCIEIPFQREKNLIVWTLTRLHSLGAQMSCNTQEMQVIVRHLQIPPFSITLVCMCECFRAHQCLGYTDNFYYLWECIMFQELCQVVCIYEIHSCSQQLYDKSPVINLISQMRNRQKRGISNVSMVGVGLSPSCLSLESVLVTII